MQILFSKPSTTKKYLFGAVFALLVLNNIYNNSQIDNFLSEYIKYWKNFSGIYEDHFSKIQSRIKDYPINPESIKIISKFYQTNSFRSVHEDIFDNLKNLLNCPLRSFCFNFIHLFNNRMGMAPAEEVIISFLGKKILGEMNYEKL